ncbi:MAG: winged helix DNA-binding protein [Frankiales bacterium]|nr:winged helix DNA-binding protein [Frankiales bacterium]
MPSDAIPAVPSNVLFEVWLLSRRAYRLLDGSLRESGLSADEFAVYSLLVAAPRSPSWLAQWMAAPLTTVSSYVRRFEQRGHVTREPDPADARSYRLALTDAGRAAHRAAGELFLGVLASVEADLGPGLDDARQEIVRTAAAIDRAASATM